MELLNRAPKFKASLDAPITATLWDTKITNSKVSVYEGAQFALLTETEQQYSTNYTATTSIVFTKENGVWKIDFIGSIKLQIAQQLEENPSGTSVESSGNADISIEALEYTFDPMVNDQETKLLVLLKNKGKTTLYQYRLWVEVNHAEVFEETQYDVLKPGKSIILEVPIDKYWTIASVVKTPGEYRTDVAVGLNPSDIEDDQDDNSYYFNTVFK
jgi:hypothetical protein